MLVKPQVGLTYCAGGAVKVGTRRDSGPVIAQKEYVSHKNPKGELRMPLFMDVHKSVPGLTAEAVADAHRKDLQTQKKHGVNYLKYWYNDRDGRVFCLCEAPSREAAETVHREAHGIVADEIIEVKEGK